MSRHSAKGRTYNRLRAEWLATADHGWICHLCGRPVQPDLPPLHDQAPTIDHIIPTSQGGSKLDTRYWRLAHYRCNRRRSTAPLLEPTQGATRTW